MGSIGRNAPCHCGSGKKYKNCHLGLDGSQKSKSKGIIIALVIGFFLVFSAVMLFSERKTSENSPPPGKAPAGKVWSAEHGHWHDA